MYLLLFALSYFAYIIQKDQIISLIVLKITQLYRTTYESEHAFLFTKLGLAAVVVNLYHLKPLNEQQNRVLENWKNSQEDTLTLKLYTLQVSSSSIQGKSKT